MMFRLLAAGVAAGLLANVTGFAITGMLFHRYQARTPGTWRPTESAAHYGLSSGIRIFACVGIGLLYGGFGAGGPAGSVQTMLRGFGFGVCLWAAAAAPIILELAVFVKWHRGFVIGLLLDWLALCALAGVASALAQSA
jgi:hypothetical protein